MKFGEIVVHIGKYNFTKFHQNQMKNKKVLLIARFSVQNFKVSVELWKSYIVKWLTGKIIHSCYSYTIVYSIRFSWFWSHFWNSRIGGCKNRSPNRRFSYFYWLKTCPFGDFFQMHFEIAGARQYHIITWQLYHVN